MAITVHATDLPVQQPLTQHPVVSEPPLEVALLLAQAVAELGTADWNAVANRLDTSEEWPADAGKMTSQGYATAFMTIMRQRGLDSSACSQPFARPTRKLVHALYSTLLGSLRNSILSSFDAEARLQQEVTALLADHPSPPPVPAPKEDKSEKRPRTPTTATRKSARKAFLPDVEEDAGAEREGDDVEMAPPVVADEENVPPGDDAEELEEEGEEPATPSRKGGRRKAGARATGRRKGRGARAATVEEEQTPAVEEQGVEDKVKEEDEDEVTPLDEGEEGEAPDGEDGEEEGDEDAQRPRRGGRKGRTPAAPPAKKAGRKRKPSEPPATSPAPSEAADTSRKRKRVKTTEEPVEESEKDAKATIQRRKAGFTRIIEQLQNERYSHFFESRVTKSIAPLYNVAVRRPTCLRDVLKAIKSGAISTSTELMRDVALLCANAMQFNGDEGEDSVGHCAKLLWERFERLMDESLSAEMSME